MTGTTWAKHEDPQRNPLPLPLLSLLKFRLWLLQTIHRPVLHIFRLFPRYLFLLFRVIHLTTTPFPPAPTFQVIWSNGIPYDLECVEIWERFARDNQFRHCGARPSSRVDQRSFFWALGIILVTEGYS